MNKVFTKQKGERGVVLLEAIVAVGILITIFTASIALFISSVSGVRITNDQLIANYLAQDGIEQVIAKRQYNFENDLPWLDGIVDVVNCPAGNLCGANYFDDSTVPPVSLLNTALKKCSVLNACLLYQDANGVYSHNSAGTPSYFTRTVEVTEINHEARVVVTVSWNDGSDVMELPITFILYKNANNNLINSG